MTAELEKQLRSLGAGDVLTCEQVQQFAAENSIAITKMKPFVDLLGMQVTGCSLLCKE